MEGHLSACPSCQAACDSLRQTLRLCGASPLPRVPALIQESIRRGIRGVLLAQRSG
jgi:hypothetical protein